MNTINLGKSFFYFYFLISDGQFELIQMYVHVPSGLVLC